jgi:hypothetical protein
MPGDGAPAGSPHCHTRAADHQPEAEDETSGGRLGMGEVEAPPIVRPSTDRADLHRNPVSSPTRWTLFRKQTWVNSREW